MNDYHKDYYLRLAVAVRALCRLRVRLWVRKHQGIASFFLILFAIYVWGAFSWHLILAHVQCLSHGSCYLIVFPVSATVWTALAFAVVNIIFTWAENQDPLECDL